jgi:Zn-dependent M28 family amino/carboxypeptidase
MKLTIVLLLVLTLSWTLHAQETKPKLATKDEMSEQLRAAPCKNSDRFEAARKLFQSMGAQDSDIETAKFDEVKNLVVRKKGRSKETIIVGAHYDKVSDGCGAIDNWTGIVTIANLYRTLSTVETEKTYLFVAFDREEIGLVGSNAMAKSIPKENRTDYCAMVNLDSFGFNYPQVMDNATTPKMRERAEVLAKELKMPLAHAAIANADADSSSFKSRDIPAITFHGLSNNWQQYLHSSKDKFENINVASVFIAYDFVLRYLAGLDTVGCGEFRK